MTCVQITSERFVLAYTYYYIYICIEKQKLQVSTTVTVASACRIYNTSDQSPSRLHCHTINGLENVKNLRKCPNDFVPPALKLHFGSFVTAVASDGYVAGEGGGVTTSVPLQHVARTSNGPEAATRLPIKKCRRRVWHKSLVDFCLAKITNALAYTLA